MNETQTFEKINKPLIKGHPEFKSAEESKAWQRDLSQKAKTSEHAMIVLSDIENTREAKSFLDGDRRCFFPKATTEPIDYDKIKFKFSKAKYKTELLQFYKDGILIKIPSIKKPSYVDIALLHRTFDSDIDHMMTSSASFNPMFRCFTSNIDTTKINPQSFFGESNFKGWTNKEFKGYIYILIDEYSRTKLLKFSLNEFIQYQKVKQIILNRKETFLNDEEYITGMDREFYADKIQDLSGVMRGGNKLFLTQRRTLKIGCVSTFFEIYSKMIGIGAHHEEVMNDELQALFKRNSKKFKEEVNNLIKDLAEHFYRKRKDINGKKAISIGRIENHLLFIRIAEWFYSSPVSLSPEERAKELFKIMKAFAELEIDDLNQIFWSFFKFPNEDNEPTEKCEKHITSLFYAFFQSFGRLIFLGFKVNNGDTLPCGTNLIPDEMTSTDAFLYWDHLPNILLLNSKYLEGHMCPLVFEDDKVLNVLDDSERFNSSHLHETGVMEMPPINKEDAEKINLVLSEALESSKGLVPKENFIEMGRGKYRLKEVQSDIIKGAQFFETENLIYVFLYDEKERFLLEVLSKREKKFVGHLFLDETFRVKDFSKEDRQKNKERIAGELYNFISTTIRDYKVCINRDVVLGPVRHRVPTGIKTNRKRIIYLPLIKYNYIGNRQALNNEVKSLRKNSGGWRNHFIRKLPDEAKASLLQKTLARRQNIEIPIGKTYVRAHMFGNREMSPPEIEYRSRRMTGSVYFSEAAIYKAEEIINMSWAGFEEHCRKIVEKMGWEITKVRNSDDGIDIEAFRSVVSGEKEKMIRLFVQCKHWKKNNIPPGVVRDLLGAKELEDKEYETELMIITSSRFSSGAIMKANEKGIKLIDGNDLLK